MKKWFLALTFVWTLSAYAFEGTVEKIIQDDRGVYLLVDDTWLLVDNFQASPAGMFVQVNDSWLPLSEALSLPIQVSWRCTKCRHYNMDGITTCSFCGKRKHA